MRVAVVGDVLLDVDLSGPAERLSPDAPVPVIDVAARSVRAGGAGLVARMLARDGHDVTLVTALADSADPDVGELCSALDGIRVVAGPSETATPVKTRIAASGQPVVRVDRGCERPPLPQVTEQMLAALDTVDVVIVADYGRRLTEDESLRAALNTLTVPLVWDPHPHGSVPVAGTTLSAPNLAEASACAGMQGRGVTLAQAAADMLLERWGCDAVVVTMGDAGALVRSRRAPAPVVVPAVAVPPGDTCGAGDRFTASAAVALARGADPAEAVGAAVADAGSYLLAGGVASLALRCDAAPLRGGGVDAVRVATAVRAAGGTIVATGGCFDLLHAGHARTLSAARALGDCLIVCLNSDASVTRLKGATRPIIPEADRVDLLLALECVDAVLVFGEDTPDDALCRIRPDVWVKGGDYCAQSLPEAATLARWGGRVLTVPYHPGRSTTHLAAALARVG
ncbi:bifunctional heptose 7-phosphate kinase/heptose 1-phosphate adenyltransferase [Rathayibacter toxicus]|uniref:D-beta-D-heptose 1-phosphate adenosyltransferase n=1 Tax=Rathayibacter toxicus TaxID=145458 RepID=A0A0C5BJ61_9MICO|nr:PfkB family carbohydrate kinase [Rathayibacter toxicus]AJM78350.1 D-beta-D-heptose 1-phosphate adenosyltransferase [Rathayibacter toxicus]ALS58225.1 D-beta-D-heptose 1-phosphate adenosyltransferase [Rathayibacter toxicus]KKM46751.1 D-beta-D-heptose 1-phosphate adenosyltransferase [Rathayibacter toxicus]PPG22486.1 bifunctional heptose 7-phosphate kinase/heptose 1-phosphate adenyltransferase [Rathayibacter toxicus]PPG47206.1 bifunctional heptose 7-phosphate kinase/heptose 1-phosphate adenyltr